MAGLRKKLQDRRRWASARTLPEMAQLMALWLEGELSMWPGYDDGAAEETAALIPTLAAANQAGFLTDQSQPGYDGRGFDGLRWQQRAAVTGLVADEQLLTRIRRAGEAAGVTVFIAHPRLLPQGQGDTGTIRGGRPYTRFGQYMPPSVLRQIWRGISKPAMAEVLDAWQVCLIDPDYGRNDRLWPALDRLFATQTTR
ncbi:hypothetical protein L0F81_00170 [Streptomyces tricolor]|uniref:DUF6919 domain-containing protein n=1 Tax=Streptomyces tricolor TaxID=68277 RepID=A0ABS9J849_9ACTN|nr:hypothetical protein [Streptomyces tricolor]MCG0061714.1 hypothetical protein [Streptomyces tricolor]